MNLMDGLNEICKLTSPETLEDENISCLVITCVDKNGNGIIRVSGNFLELMDLLDMMINHIAKHSKGTLTRTRILDALQLYTKKEE